MVINKDDFIFVKENSTNSESSSKSSTNYWDDVSRRLKENKVAMLSLFVLFLIVILSIIVPIISPYNFEVGELTMKNNPPSKQHIFGTDQLGRDIFTRVFVGGRVSLLIGFLGASIVLIIGVIYGGVAGYFGGIVDDIMMRIIELLSGIPSLLVIIIISLVLGGGMGSLIIAMTATGWIFTARLVRGEILSLKNEDYILASRAIGTNPLTIIRKHLIPNVASVVIVSMTMNVPSFILSEATLSYIGLGVQSPMTSWGALASDAQNVMIFYPYQMFFPALMISLTMLAFQLFGDGLRDALDPRLRQ